MLMSEIQFIVNTELCIGADKCGGVCARICPPDIIEYAEENGKKIPCRERYRAVHERSRVPEQLPGEGNHHPSAAGRGRNF